MLVELHVVVLAVLGSVTTYLLILSILAALASLKSSFATDTQRKFAIVVPAHNEELSIGKTIKSLLEIEYPRKLYDVITIADNCTDRTADIAREAGGMVFERQDNKHRGKGFALRWCFEKLNKASADYSGIVVIDADSTASKNFLSVMNYYLEQGAKVIQSADLVAPQPGAWSSEATRLGFFLYNYVRPLGRKVIGLSAGLRGNGMCFTMDILRDVPWEAYSLNEDLEYGLLQLIKGNPTVFAPEAVVLATMPSNPVNAQSQRARWEGGRLPLLRKFVPHLLKEAVKQRRLSLIDALIDLVIPALVNILVVALLMAIVTLLLGALGFSGIYWFSLGWILVFLIGISHLIVGIAASGDADLWRLLKHVPRYVIWKLALYLKLVSKGRITEWVRTTREPEGPVPGQQEKDVESRAGLG